VLPQPGGGSLALVGQVSIGTQAHGVAVAGTLAHVATATGLTIVDLSIPSAPVVRGAVSTGSGYESQGVAVAGSYAYLAAGYAGVYVIDVSNPDAPSVVGQLAVTANVWDVAVKSHYVYATSFSGLLSVIDVADPAAPRLVKRLGLLTWKGTASDAEQMAKLRDQHDRGSAKSTSVFVTGDHLFTNDWNYGRLYYYDVSDPANPVFAGTHYYPFVLKVAADPVRDVVYMLGAYGSFSGVATVPLSRLDPFVGSEYSTCAECRFLRAATKINQGGMAMSGTGDRVLYAGGAGEFRSVDVANLAQLAAETTLDIGAHGLALAETLGVAVAGEHVVLGAGDLGVLVYRRQ
jgi:hypothetical protein